VSSLATVLIVAPAAAGAFAYAVKRLAALDIEVRTERERQRGRYWRERARRDQFEHAAATKVARVLISSDFNMDSTEQELIEVLVSLIDLEPRGVFRRATFASRTAEILQREGVDDDVIDALFEELSADELRAHVAAGASVPLWALALLGQKDARRTGVSGLLISTS
jgi:hypothetical protein